MLSEHPECIAAAEEARTAKREELQKKLLGSSWLYSEFCFNSLKLWLVG